jgi:hypothetical protein
LAAAVDFAGAILPGFASAAEAAAFAAPGFAAAALPGFAAGAGLPEVTVPVSP